MANTKGSNNPFPSILVVEGTEPTAPSAGQQRLYIDSTTHKLKRTDSSGTDVTIESTSSGGTLATVEEVDGSPTDSAVTKLVFPNGTLGIASHVATYTPAAGGALASASFKRTTGNYTTTSSTFVDVDATNFALTITTGAHRVMLVFTGSGGNTSADYIELDVTVDGTRQGGTGGLVIMECQDSLVFKNLSFTYITDVLTAASHTFKLQYRVNSSGTATIQGGSSSPTMFCKFAAIELGA
jgi:hypothetical protein